MSVVDPPRWTIETVLAHLLALRQADQDAVRTAFSAQKGAVDAALAAADRAVLKAEVAADKRFDGVNEFRGTLADQQRTLIPRAEVVVMMTSLSDRVDAISKQMEKIHAERAGILGGWGYAVGVAGFILTLFSLGMVVWNFKP